LQKESKDKLAQLTVRRYEGSVCLVVTSHDLDRARHEFRREHVVGLDTETQPAFRKGEAYLPSLVQVATSRAVYLFPLKRLDFAEALTELLENPAIAKAGIGLGHDFTKLKMRFPFEEKNVVDLSAVARRHGMEQTGVRNLAALFLGFRITKGQKTSNWGRAELTQNQILYAATDAWVCRELYLCFQKQGLIQTH
jgi:ribonuclease D